MRDFFICVIIVVEPTRLLNFENFVKKYISPVNIDKQKKSEAEMNAAQTTLIFSTQDGRMLSCKRWFISIMVFNFNALILLLFGLGFLGCFQAQNPTLAMETPSKVHVSEINEQNELVNWLDKMSVKYARYKLSYPKDGIIHAKGTAAAGKNLVRVNIIEINRKVNPSLEIKPQTGSSYLNSRVKIKTIASKNNAIAAINGGYFKPQTGVPLGALMIDNELLTGPIYKRAAIGFNSDGTYSVGKTDIKFHLQNKKINIKVDNINQPRMLSTYTLLYNDKWGAKSPPPPKYGLNVVIQNGMVKGMFHEAVPISKGDMVISAPSAIAKSLLGQKKLSLKIEYPKAFEKSEHIVSGGPFLIKDGEIYIDTNEEKLSAIGGRNPRTMIGYTKNNDLIMVTVDGREKHSVGMSLYEGAQFMKKLGCENAINLDGGSSSVMYINGVVTNLPPETGGIPIAGAITVVQKQITAIGKENTDEM